MAQERSDEKLKSDFYLSFFYDYFLISSDMFINFNDI